MTAKLGCLAFALVLLPAMASAATDCSPLTVLRNYTSDATNEARGAAELREFDSHDFQTATGAQSITGKWCSQTYLLKAGVEEPAPAVIVRGYRQQFQQLGATVLADDGCQIDALLKKSGGETWMHVGCAQGFAGSYSVVVVEKAGLKLSLTQPAADDYPLLGHLPDYVVVRSEKSDAGELSFPVAAGGVMASVQGKRLHLDYAPKAGAQAVSDLEATENYVAAIRAQGGEVIFQDRTDVTARLPGGGQTIWLRVNSLFGKITLDVVEENPFESSTQLAKSDVLKAALEKDGHVALYVNFDFGRATLRPDASPVIAQVVALLKANPAYRLSIEGHTDNIGGNAANQTLSEARAASVVGAVVKGGIEPSRLSSAGHGASSPVAPNATSEGRARNRRVELVKP